VRPEATSAGDASAARDATELARRLAAGELSARDAVREALERGEREAGELNCYLEVLRERALARAGELDRQRSAGVLPGPLHGVPFGFKASICLEGAATGAASRVLEGWRAPYTATALERLQAAGAVPLAVTNMDEFAMGSSGEHSAYGPVRNPWDLSRTPGGSSSGSAAAVAAGLVPFALGSDTGGSVRQPAAFSGVAGFKPSWGRISRYGLIAFASSLDQIGVLAGSARDLELVFGVLAGPDARDATSVPTPPPPPLGAPDLAGVRIGLLEMQPGLDPEVAAAVEAAGKVLAGLGAEVVSVRLPHAELALPAYYVVATAEASSNLARFDGMRYGRRAAGGGTLAQVMARTRGQGFGREVKRRILLGTHALRAGYQDAWYERAARVRELVRGDYQAAFERVDLVIGPTAPTGAFELGEKRGDPLSMYLADVLTVPPSLAGLPAASVPCGSAAGLPVGLQIVGAQLDDARVLWAARRFQEATAHHLRRPAPRPTPQPTQGGGRP
jgi:aspartyl-tRNA(Asn)/glutamyl-tRNA(Gln) amidotransferase subunit A